MKYVNALAMVVIFVLGVLVWVLNVSYSTAVLDLKGCEAAHINPSVLTASMVDIVDAQDGRAALLVSGLPKLLKKYGTHCDDGMSLTVMSEEDEKKYSVCIGRR